MNLETDNNTGLDTWVNEALCEPMPEEVEHQLRQRIEIVRGQLAARKRELLTRRHFGWVAVAAGASAVAIAVPLMYPGTPAAWAEVVAATREHPWMHFSGIHFNGTRFQFWVSLRHGIHAMKAGDVEFAHFQSKATKTRHWYRKSEGMIHQEAYRRPPGELGHLETLLDQMATGAKIEVAGPDEIVAQARRESVQDGIEVWEYEFTLKAFDQGHANTYVVVFEVDPKTHLPRRWSRKSVDGNRTLTFDIDYPAEGPKDIFALGVPITTKVQKRD